MKIPSRFYMLVGSQFFSKIGDYAHDIVFVILSIEISKNNYLLVGLIYFIKFIPYLFLGPLGGAIADKYNRKNVMILSDVSRCIFMLILALCYFANSVNIILLMIIGFVYTSFRTIFQPAYQATITTMLDKDLLIKGNSLSEVCNQIASIIGPLICSLLIVHWSKGFAVLLDSLTFAISFLCIMKINISQTIENDVVNIKITNLYKEVLYKIRSLPDSKILFDTIVISAVCIFFTGSLIRFVLPAHILNVTNNESYIGYAMSIMAVGSILGAILFSRVKVSNTGSSLMFCWALYGALFILISLLHNIYFSIVAIFTLGVVGVVVDILLVYNIQTFSKPDEIGKNFGIFSTFANTAEAFSNLISGIAGLISIGVAFTVMSIFLCVIPGYKYVRQSQYNFNYPRNVKK